METAYKMFNKDLTCTKGKGVFRYEPGVWYEEPESNCSRNGFHCAKNPLDCLRYYRNWDLSVCWLVSIAGTIDEDSIDSKVSATRIRLDRELTLSEFVLAAGNYIIDHPNLPNSSIVKDDNGIADQNHFTVVRGKNPRAMGKDEGDILCLLKEEQDNQQIEAAGIYMVSTKGNHKPQIWYDVDGREAREC